MNRRHFLSSLGAFLALAYSKQARALTSLGDDFKGRLRKISSKVFFAGDTGFEEQKSLINPGLVPENPLAILRTDSIEEISKAANTCSELQIPVRIRGGGHSFEGFSMGKGVVLDVRDLKSFRVKPTHVEAGAGLTLGELKERLEVHGLSFPTGTCPTVGLGGYLLGGGHSVKSRLWGLGADRVQAMKVVLANGQRAQVSPRQSSDLYWALLGGGGGNLALVEEFHLDLIPAGQDLIFKYVFRANEAARVFEFWEKQALQTENSITVQLLLSFNSGKLDWVQIFGIFNCINLKNEDPQKIFQQSVWSELEQLNPINQEISIVSSNKSRKEGGEAMPFKGHSHYADKVIGRKGFEFIQEVAKSTLRNTRVSMVFEPLGGAIQNPSRRNSYPHRQCLFNIEFYAGFRKLEQKEFYSQSLTGFHQGVAPLFSGRCYVNYPNLDLGSRAQESYFGENLKALLKIKKKYDPTNSFDYGAQSLAESLRNL